ncbi:uncharacterized protein MONOS_3786 [Monocercomonoides exilis]|uniref:uncharacterized protein n=1 Tax=Monocercomonoides exilis TaxID=2049356 RepID=UPI00355943E4|nr:hypothetical protein MONOS_3786 [Monocercomonoides exilis]|eukprot:MONOS_3786.1-p1 / transcript=MONOS_3786.1 / gene=MONOS_3786 / organism=Monocercomonoides_exilis_PA203 / gene_product=unspecified product / transcript_product=unspecified product / location=Mono_scaffold00092:97661-98990(-) / protein_length=252 / sequence_SO=supercontig / SO=protein_coding / is_pseudo=false
MAEPEKQQFNDTLSSAVSYDSRSNTRSPSSTQRKTRTPTYDGRRTRSRVGSPSRDTRRFGTTSSRTQRAGSPFHPGRTIVEEEEFHHRHIERVSRSPGPIYQVDESSKVVMPRTGTTKFGSDSREKYFQTVALYPGPKYDPKDDTTTAHRASPKPAFGKEERKSWFVKKTAFEGHYHTLPKPTVCSTTSSAPTVGFKKDGRFKKDSASAEVPGPGSYSPPSTVGVKRSNKVGGTFSGGYRDCTDWCFTSIH